MSQVSTEEITIRVDEATAKAYAALSSTDQKKMQILLNLRLKRGLSEPSKKDPSRLEKIVKEANAEAAAMGMTPERLEALLNEE